MRLLKDTFIEWWNDQAPQLSAALAFYTIFSIAPLLIIAIVVASSIYGREAARQELLAQVTALVGPDGADVVRDALAQARQNSPLATVVGVGTALAGSSIVFAQLHDSLNRIWEVTAKPGIEIRQFIKKRVLSFLMVLVIGMLLVASLTLGAVLSAASDALSARFAISPTLFETVNTLTSFLLMTLLFAVVFRVLPDVRIAWKDVAMGAAVTSVLITLGKYLIGLYLGRSTVGSAYGVAGSFVLLLLWVYYSAQVFFLGAEFTQVYARSRGRPIQPAPHAVRVRRRAPILEDTASE